MLKKQVLLIFAGLLAIAPLFHNCGSQMASQVNAFKSSSACETDMLPVFEETYYKFFSENNCKNCHSSSGISSIPHFADPIATTGLSYFMKLGPDHIENKLRAGHQGYNFTNLQPILNSHKEAWNDEVQAGACTNQAIDTAGKNILFFEPDPEYPTEMILKQSMLDWQTISWNLDNGTSSNTDGVDLSIDVKVAYNPLFMSPQNYLVSNLKVRTRKHGVHIKGIYILLNGETYSVTTFKAVDSKIPKGPDFQAITEGSSAAVFMKDFGQKYENADRWSVQIEVFDAL